ncbi:MAG: hypothetical protein LWX09_10720 [Bacteroidia bacterium]|nr:hypothetical protein [Bacteroidia bacterium]
MTKTAVSYHAPAAAEKAGTGFRGENEIHLATLVLFPALALAVARISGLASFRLKDLESILWIKVERLSRKHTQFFPFCTTKHIFRLGMNRFD